MDYPTASARQLAALVRKKEVSATEVARCCLDAMAAAEPTVGAFLCRDEEGMLARAAALDKAISAGEDLGSLAGVPVAVKDNICTKAMPTTCASRMLESFRPPYNAAAVEKLAAAGALVPGKSNLDEFAMGSSCERSYFGPTRNPWDVGCVPGGSSGGSAAAVAAGMVPLALGSDTGGSIRQPAAFCGVVGLRPTYGAVSRYGLVAFASSLEQIGPLGRGVEDVALLCSKLCGAADPRDATSRAFAFDARVDLCTIQNLRIGVPKEYFGPYIANDVRDSVEAAIRQMEALGARVVEVNLPSTRHALAAYTVISSAEAASNLARYDGVKLGRSAGQGGTLDEVYRASRSEGFGDEVKRRILLGTHVLCAGQRDDYYRRARDVQRDIAAEFAAAFETCDLLATPTVPTTAFKLGEYARDTLAMYASDTCAVPASLAGLPALSLPCGLDKAGLPVGLQLIGPRFGEARILAAALAYEQAVGGFAASPVASPVAKGAGA